MRYILYLHRLSPYFILIILINCKSEISFKEGELFSNEVADFNFELSPDQIFSDISDLDFAYTQVFSQEQENGLQISNHQFQKVNFNSNDPSLECSLGDLSQYGNTNEVDIEKSEKKNAINDQLNSIFRTSKEKNKKLANRKDVINKAILRGFKKFFVNLLTQSKVYLPETSKKSKQVSEQSFTEQIEKLGFMNLKPNESSQEEFSEFICWMGYPKITKKVRSLFSFSNPAIILMEDVLSSYSHHKLNQFMSNKLIKVLLSYFILHGKEQFMNSIGLSIKNHDSLIQNSFSDLKKDAECYEEALQNIYNQISSP